MEFSLPLIASTQRPREPKTEMTMGPYPKPTRPEPFELKNLPSKPDRREHILTNGPYSHSLLPLKRGMVASPFALTPSAFRTFLTVKHKIFRSRLID